ncbi:LacI family DNA-binding transcriptional regulator [Ruficoccus sp. ZRK36]|uniref:LacI family DNA-binding transcriptional regulator n=1 Tax=Ruficoccus sp. ZRK36 TaxID=2866311 RepID=UPI001C732AF9|nr:LacI family DNA-binding transcriptional regulator [Ruficoccus sp. ZRK36]QYY35023.1 LacI family transcriptional regulator [Ruficoccus sp. ZRK36]
MDKKRVTQEDVAKEAGVHRATVSLSLRSHPSIPEKTRERVIEAARKLGYAPDPMLSALAMYRNTTRSHAFHGTLAWLVFTDQRDFDWRDVGVFRQYHQGALARAKENGFTLETFEFNPNEIPYDRQASILKARNIRGILLFPQPLPRVVEGFPWDDFSMVTFGYSLLKPELHTVCSTQYRAMLQTMHKLHEKGYRRISLAIGFGINDRTDNNFLAGYLAAQYRIGEPPLVHQRTWGWDLDAFINRLREEKPEAVIVDSYYMVNLMKRSGLRIPEDLAVVCPMLSCEQTDVGIAGVTEDGYHVGEVAVDHLTRMLQRGETGVPEKVLRIHVEGIWHDSPTLPALKRKKAKKAPRSRRKNSQR